MSRHKSYFRFGFMMNPALQVIVVCVGLMGFSFGVSALTTVSSEPLPVNVNVDQKKKDGKKKNKHYLIATDPSYKNYVFMYEDGKRLTPSEVEDIPAEKIKGVSVLKEVAAEVCMTEKEKKAGKTHVMKIILKE